MPETSTAFELTAFFAGPVQAAGFFEDRFGTVRRRFTVAMNGAWEGSAFVLHESFDYDDGERQHRVWRVIPAATGGFIATTGDIVGVVRGLSTKDAIVMRYRMRMAVEGRDVVLSFVDRIYQMNADSAFSRATVTKWGVKLGEVLITYRRLPVELAKAGVSSVAQAEDQLAAA